MALFGKKAEEQSTALLGVDIGTSGMKVVELMPEAGRIRLVTYGYADIPVGVSTDALSLDDPKKIADILRTVVKTSGMKAVKAVAALPASSVFHAIITIPTPKSAKEDIRPAVEAQAGKLLPLPIEEMIIDSHIIDKELLPKEGVEVAASAKTVRVQVTAAPKVLVEKYIAVFKLAKLELISLETEVFALMRSLIGKDNARVLLIDIGGERTNIVVAERGVPYVTRGTKVGGSVVTQALAAAMGLGMPEAEATKKDLALGKKKKMSPALLAATKPLLHEAKYTLDMNTDVGEGKSNAIDKVIMTGGGAMLAGLNDAMTDTLKTNVYIGDPWARVATPPGARAVLDEVGSRFAVAIGLAMRVAPEKDR